MASFNKKKYLHFVKPAHHVNPFTLKVQYNLRYVHYVTSLINMHKISTKNNLGTIIHVEVRSPRMANKGQCLFIPRLCGARPP